VAQTAGHVSPQHSQAPQARELPRIPDWLYCDRQHLPDPRDVLPGLSPPRRGPRSARFLPPCSAAFAATASAASGLPSPRLSPSRCRGICAASGLCRGNPTCLHGAERNSSGGSAAAGSAPPRSHRPPGTRASGGNRETEAEKCELLKLNNKNSWFKARVFHPQRVFTQLNGDAATSASSSAASHGCSKIFAPKTPRSFASPSDGKTRPG